MEEATQVASSEVPVVKGDADDLKTVDVSVKVMNVRFSYRLYVGSSLLYEYFLL